MYSAGSSEYLMMSIFSPFSSSTMVFTRCPLGPTQAPMGSTLGSADQTVKDNRTAYETSNINGVMDGDLDGFINAYLTAEATGNWAEK